MATIPLRNRQGQVVAEAIVDDADAPEVLMHRWHLNSRGYVRRSEYRDGKVVQTLLHRQLLGLTDPKIGGDHRNGDKLDNRRSNLRAATNAQNHQNRSGSGDRGSSSRFRGVSLVRGRWMAYGTLDGKQHHLGYFDTEDEAAEAASSWRQSNMPYATCR